MQHTENANDGNVVRNERISWRRLPLAALLAAGAAVVANTLLYLVVSGLGFISRDVLIATSGGESPLTGGESPLTGGMVAGASAAGAIAGP